MIFHWRNRARLCALGIIAALPAVNIACSSADTPDASASTSTSTGAGGAGGEGGSGEGGSSVEGVTIGAPPSVVEGDSGTTKLTFELARAGDTSGTCTVAWTQGGTASQDDFEAAQALSGVVSFAAGETSATIDLNVQGDKDVEQDETVVVTLSSPEGCALGDSVESSATVTNDDGEEAVMDGCDPAKGLIHVPADMTFAAALTQAETTGKHVVLADGNHTLGTIGKSGTAAEPIVICAEHKLKATISGSTTVKGDHVRLWGLSFGNKSLSAEGSDVWLQRCEFSGFDSGMAIQVTVSGDSFRFWRSTIKNSKSRGLSFNVGGGGVNGQVYRSYFANFTGAMNATEPLQLGMDSKDSKIDAKIQVLESMFENCKTTNGENETVSVKSSSNVVKGSTFLETRYLFNRHGEHNLYVSNWIEGGDGIGLNGFDNTALEIKTVNTGSGVRVASGDVTPAKFPDGCPDSGSCNPVATSCKVIACDADKLIIGDDAGALKVTGTSVEGTTVNGKLVDTQAKLAPYLGPKAGNGNTAKAKPSMSAPKAVKLSPSQVGPDS